MDVDTAAWYVLRKVVGLFPKINVEAGVLGKKTVVNRRIVRSMSAGGRVERKGIIDNEQRSMDHISVVS